MWVMKVIILLSIVLALNIFNASSQNINYQSKFFIKGNSCVLPPHHLIICSDAPTTIIFRDSSMNITTSFIKVNSGCDTIKIDTMIIDENCIQRLLLNQKKLVYVEASENITVYECLLPSDIGYPGHYFCRLIPPSNLAGTANIDIGYTKSFTSPFTGTYYTEYGSSLMLVGIDDSSIINVYPKWPHPLLNGNYYYSIPLQKERGYYESSWNSLNSPDFPLYYPPCLVTQDSTIGQQGKFIARTGMYGFGTGMGTAPWGLSAGFFFYPLAYEFLGKNYHTVPHLTRAGDSLLAIAFHDSTVINLNGISNVINRGDVFRVLLDTPGVWQANHPFSLVQISRHQQEDSVLYSSLFAYSVHPDSALLKSTWYTTEIVPDSTPGEQSYLNLVAPSNGVATVKLDGNSLSSYFIPYPGDSIWSYAQIPVTSVQHKLEADSGVIAYAYQYSLGCGVGFYVGGLEMKNTVTGISSSPVESPLRVYPNPAHTLLYIEHGEHISRNKFIRVNIYSADGRSVLSTSVKNSSRIELDVALPENGLYFIELSSEFESLTTKFVKN